MAEEKSKQEKISEPKEPEKPRFRLLFINTVDLGKSNLSKPKLPGFYGSAVTSKFYSIRDFSDLAESEDIRLISEEISKLNSLGPKEKYKKPVLENHRYGWFQEKFIEMHLETERVHFPKRNSTMVKVQNLTDHACKANQIYQTDKAKNKCA